MPSFETVCQQIFRQPDALRKLLIGGLILTIPVANVFALGFLYEMASESRRRRRLHLPEWEAWDSLFANGLRMVGLFLIFAAPVLVVGYLLSALLRLVFYTSVLGLLGEHLSWQALTLGFMLSPLMVFGTTVGQIPFFAALAWSPLLWMHALRRFLRVQSWREMWRWQPIWRSFNRVGWRQLIPLAVFVCCCLFSYALLGFSVFPGLVLLVAYFVALDTGVSGEEFP